MPLQRYDVRDEVSGTGEWVMKYWSPSNHPIFPLGSKEIIYIVHQVEDMTGLVRFGTLPEVEKLFNAAIDIRTKHVVERSGGEELETRQKVFSSALAQLKHARRDSLDQVDWALRRLEAQVQRVFQDLSWQKAYYDAIYEDDPRFLRRRIASAEWAILMREKEISILPAAAHSELKVLKEAQANLKELRRQRDLPDMTTDDQGMTAGHECVRALARI